MCVLTALDNDLSWWGGELMHTFLWVGNEFEKAPKMANSILLLRNLHNWFSRYVKQVQAADIHQCAFIVASKLQHSFGSCVNVTAVVGHPHRHVLPFIVHNVNGDGTIQ